MVKLLENILQGNIENANNIVSSDNIENNKSSDDSESEKKRSEVLDRRPIIQIHPIDRLQYKPNNFYF